MSLLMLKDVLNQVPPLPTKKGNLRVEISTLLNREKVKIVVLDDDSTGIQTVHGCLLLTKWSEKNLDKAFSHHSSFFYVLTNSRSLTPQEVKRIYQDILQHVIAVNKRHGFRLLIISRSDSTLRGHFPLEPDIIAEVLEDNHIKVMKTIFFAPVLFEAGRYTYNDIHYLEKNGKLIPVAETEFARDNVFCYSHSCLEDFIIEKTNQRIGKRQIGSLSIDFLRNRSIQDIKRQILYLRDKDYMIINAFNYFELRKFSLAVLEILTEQDSSAIFRTSSSFVKAISGIRDKSMLVKQDLLSNGGIGIFIVGSHVQMSTAQLEKLLQENGVRGIEVKPHDTLLNPNGAVSSTLHFISETVNQNITPVIYTSREEIRYKEKRMRIKIGQSISAALVDIMRRLPFRPSYIVAKGGITSNDILKYSLDIESATVEGQILPGVPVIVTERSNKYPSVPYIIFPGNVGTEESLAEVYRLLKPSNFNDIGD